MARAFAVRSRVVNAMPDGPDKRAAQGAVGGLKVEASQGPAGDKKRVRKWLNFLAETSADDWEAAESTSAYPSAGLDLAFKKIAERAKAETAQGGEWKP